MLFQSIDLRDAAIIDVERHEDERGFLARTYCEREFAEHGLAMPIVLTERNHRLVYVPKGFAQG